MADIKTKYSQELIATFRWGVENVVSRCIVTSAYFDFLSQTILRVVGQPISPTTLKRIWDYVVGSPPSAKHQNHDGRLYQYLDSYHS